MCGVTKSQDKIYIVSVLSASRIFVAASSKKTYPLMLPDETVRGLVKGKFFIGYPQVAKTLYSYEPKDATARHAIRVGGGFADSLCAQL